MTIPNLWGGGGAVLGHQNWALSMLANACITQAPPSAEILKVYHYCPPGDAAGLRNIVIGNMTKPFKLKNKNNLED